MNQTQTMPTGPRLADGRPYRPADLTRDEILEALVTLADDAAKVLGEEHASVAYARLAIGKARRMGRAAE